MTSDGDAILKARIDSIKGVVKRITEKREKAIINKLVRQYIDGELDESKAYSSIMLIAELRHSVNEVSHEDI